MGNQPDGQGTVNEDAPITGSGQREEDPTGGTSGDPKRKIGQGGTRRMANVTGRISKEGQTFKISRFMAIFLVFFIAIGEFDALAAAKSCHDCKMEKVTKEGWTKIYTDTNCVKKVCATKPDDKCAISLKIERGKHEKGEYTVHVSCHADNDNKDPIAEGKPCNAKSGTDGGPTGHVGGMCVCDGEDCNDDKQFEEAKKEIDKILTDEKNKISDLPKPPDQTTPPATPAPTDAPGPENKGSDAACIQASIIMVVMAAVGCGLAGN